MKMVNIPWKRNVVYRESNMEKIPMEYGNWKNWYNKGKIQCKGYL